ncbi:MAG: SAM-dependent methyltransferase [Pseudomonadota bacterium]
MSSAFDLASVVPWGRNRAEYFSFFDLSALSSNGVGKLRILDCAAGPASFNAEMTAMGWPVVSVDPLYVFSAPDIAARIEATRGDIMAGLLAAKDRFAWHDYGDPEAVEVIRLSAMKFFLKDFDDGLVEGRYRAANLPDLPFADYSFDLALCSHFLFLYSGQLDLNFHLAAIDEMLRLAPEARIFPLLDLDGNPSVYLDPVIKVLREKGRTCEVLRVPYEFQKGGNEMLKIS